MCILLCLASLAEQNVLCNLWLWKLDGFQFRAIMNITAMNIILQAIFLSLSFISLRYMPSSGVAGLHSESTFNLERSCLFVKVAMLCMPSRSKSLRLGTVSHFNYCPSRVEPHCDFNILSLMTNDGEFLFISLKFSSVQSLSRVRPFVTP